MKDQTTARSTRSPRARQVGVRSEREFVHRTLMVVGIVVGVAALISLVLFAADLFLLIFAGILLAVLLRGLSDPLSKYTRLPTGWSLAVVTLSLAIVVVLGGWLIAARVSAQLDLLTETLPGSLAKLEQYLSDYVWGRKLLERAPSASQLLFGRADIVGRVSGVYFVALGIVTTVVIVLFVGLYLAADPGLYRRGLLHLVPIDKRGRADEICDALGRMLRWWLLSRLLSMTLVSIATTIGLWLLGIPAALALGLFTFLLTFIPYLGDILAAVPAVLFALSLSDPLAPVYVALLYFAIQTLEGYLLTPIVQARAVSMPPVVTLTAQVLLGVLFGMPGIVLATPLAAVGLVLVKMLYVEDTLGDVGE